MNALHEAISNNCSMPDGLHKRLKYLAIDGDTTMQKIFLDASNCICVKMKMWIQILRH